MSDYMFVSKYMAAEIYKTSDEAAALLYHTFESDSVARRKVLKEYMYLKYAIAVWLLNNNAEGHPNQKQNIEECKEEIRQILTKSFKWDPFRCGCTVVEMVGRYLQGSQPGLDDEVRRDLFASEFYNEMWKFRGVAVLPYDACGHVVDFAVNRVFNAMREGSKAADQAVVASNNGGCLSTIACLGIIFAVMMVVIF